MQDGKLHALPFEGKTSLRIKAPLKHACAPAQLAGDNRAECDTAHLRESVAVDPHRLRYGQRLNLPFNHKLLNPPDSDTTAAAAADPIPEQSPFVVVVPSSNELRPSSVPSKAGKRNEASEPEGLMGAGERCVANRARESMETVEWGVASNLKGDERTEPARERQAIALARITR